MIRVAIADDHTLFRKGIAALLASIDYIEVVGEAATGKEIIHLAEAVQPDVILMDLQMPDGNGIEATQSILSTNAQVKVLVITMFDDDPSIFAAIRSGASGYILKGADQAEMVRAIEATANGEALFSPSVARKMQNFFNQPEIPALEFSELTQRELVVLGLIVQGMTNAEIAEKLVISPKTLSNHITSIFNKLQVADRSQAILYAQKHGFLHKTFKE